jgi:uncharacterized coiled-coil protein SlyX
MMMSDRVTKLEELFSIQAHTIDQMSGEMFQQQREIAALKRELVELKERLDNQGSEIGGHERPPHY